MIRARWLWAVVFACLATAILVTAPMRVAADASPSPAPAAVASLPPIAAVGAGHLFDCVLGTDGSVWCWGFNEHGQLGDGTTRSRDLPAQVPLPARAGELAVFYATVCALLAGGEVWCWGENSDGQVGIAASANQPTPVRVPGLPPILHLARGGFEAFCALTSAGEAWCWGDNEWGELGTGDREKRDGPVPVRVVREPITSIVAAWDHTCVTVQGGGIRCWGFGMTGELGDGTYDISTEAVVPLGLETVAVKDLRGGFRFSCALLFEDSVWCWGDNANGQLGAGDTEVHVGPVRAIGLPAKIRTLVVSDTVDNETACAVMHDRTAWCWGQNDLGSLGDGTAERRPAPVKILETDLIDLSIGGDHGLALRADGSLVTWGGSSPTPRSPFDRPDRDNPSGSVGPGRSGAVQYRPAGPTVPAITTTIPRPGEISTDPPVVGANLLLAALAMLAFTISTEFLNRSLGEAEPLLRGWLLLVARARGARDRAAAAVAAARGPGRLGSAVRIAVIVLFYGVVFALLDPSWNPLSLAGVWLVASFAVGCGLVGFADDFASWAAARRWGAASRVSIRPGNLLFVLASTAVTRVFVLVPGVMLGVPEAVEVEEERIPERRRDLLPVYGLAAVVAVGLAAWLATAATAGASRDVPVLGDLLAGFEAFLLLVFSVTLQNSWVQLLPFAGSAGASLRRRSRIAWAAGLLAVTFVFMHTLVNPRGDLAKALGSTNVQAFLVTVGAVVAVSAALFAVGAVRRRRAASRVVVAPPFPAPPLRRP